MAISYQTDGVKMPAIKKRETTAWIKAVAGSYEKKIGEIAYIFCSDEKIIEDWSKALKEIVDDGTYAKLMQKYE